MLTRRSAIAALMAVGGCATAPEEAQLPGPPLWRVEGKAPVFLFGQTPLPKGIQWRTPKIDASFAASQEIWFENPDFDPVSTNAAMQKRRAAGGPTLGELIDEKERARLTAALAKAGMVPDALDKELPSFAYVALSGLNDRISEMDPASIPERVLKPAAKAAGKIIRSEWASMEEIMEFSGGASQAEQMQLVSKTLDELGGPEALRARADAWAQGDISFQAERDAMFRERYPHLSARLVRERNIKWSGFIDDMLARGVTAFCCVGLGHVVGPDAIQAHVATRGHRVVRL
jgi:uncharacterized protein YbaP (TraB family)